MKHQTVVILDFGSQYSQLIARRVRDLNVHSVILSCTVNLKKITAHQPIGIILSGGPDSVYADNAPRFNREVFDLGVPILGICYGLQSVIHSLGGRVAKGEGGGEYGSTRIRVDDRSPIMAGIEGTLEVWMSHGDRVESLPRGFVGIAESASCPWAAVEGIDGRFFGLQFHPEVTHTKKGEVMLRNFLYGICHATGDWEMTSFIDDAVTSIRARAAGEKVVLGLSGGVDSSVTALLIHKAIGDRLECILVDNCFMRMNEVEQVRNTFRDHFNIKLHTVDASDRFLAAIQGISDPEEKRKRIGNTFVEIFKEAAQRSEEHT
ncbi:MAG: glutamine-hydrolyzing GMP synthase, partial [Planctomycetota bacterium]